MTFWARWNHGALTVWLAAGVIIAATVAAVSALLRASVGAGSLVLLLLVLVLAPLSVFAVLYALGFLLLQYRWSRDGLEISAGLFRLLVPMGVIQGVCAAPEDASGLVFQGVRFRGHNVGLIKTVTGKRILYLATEPAEDCLHVVTGRRVYAISPADGEQFLRRFETERALGALADWHETVQVSWVLHALVWSDRLGGALVLIALLAGLVLLAMAFVLYPGLPEAVAMHYDPLGRPDLMVPPQRIFHLPLIGSCVTLANFGLAIAFYERERLISYFLWGGAALVQVLLIVALRAIAA